MLLTHCHLYVPVASRSQFRAKSSGNKSKRNEILGGLPWSPSMLFTVRLAAPIFGHNSGLNLTRKADLNLPLHLLLKWGVHG